jgi:hypothetical protein
MCLELEILASVEAWKRCQYVTHLPRRQARTVSSRYIGERHRPGKKHHSNIYSSLQYYITVSKFKLSTSSTSICSSPSPLSSPWPWPSVPPLWRSASLVRQAPSLQERSTSTTTNLPPVMAAAALQTSRACTRLSPRMTRARATTLPCPQEPLQTISKQMSTARVSNLVYIMCM